MSFFQTITLIDVLDVVVLAALIYQVMLIFRRTRASQLIMGIVYFALLFLVAFIVGMTATTWVFERLVGLFAIALLIIFQPELRSFFERAGRRGFLLASGRGADLEDIEQLLDTIVQALIDYVANQPESQLDGAGDPRVGMSGASYGGGIQFITAARDSRVEVIAPDIAWNSLVTALFKDRAVKSGWGTVLWGAGNASGLAPGHPIYPYGIRRSFQTNTFVMLCCSQK